MTMIDMWKALAGVVVVVLVIVALVVGITLVGRALERPERNSCLGHGGVVRIAKDATNGQIPVVCRDGYVFKVDTD